MIDTHCHVYNEYYDNIDDIMYEAKEIGVEIMINNACDLKTSYEVLDSVKVYKNMYGVLGVHPTENLDDVEEVLNLIKDNLNNKKIIGVGEIGLDYHYGRESRMKQIDVFKKQLDFASKNHLPVIIHCRDSVNDMLDILKQYKLKGIIHCFTGSVETAREYIKLGYKLGINGTITFKNCKLINVIKEVGIQNIVFETDSPYLTPEPNRGMKNEPSFVNEVYEFVSKSLNISKEDLVTITNNNVFEIFDNKFNS